MWPAFQPYKRGCRHGGSQNDELVDCVRFEASYQVLTAREGVPVMWQAVRIVAPAGRGG